MYKLDTIGSVDEARAIKPEALAPTSDALSLHGERVHYQAIAWKQGRCSKPHLPDPETLRWEKIADNKLQPLLVTQDPIPLKSLPGNHLMLMLYWMFKSPLQ